MSGPIVAGNKLRVRTMRSVAWYSVTRAGAQLVSWVVTILIAAWLTPTDYGLFAMALAVVALLEMFQELGMETAIVQRRDLTRPQIDGVFWVVSLASFGLVAVAWLGAGLVARFYAEPRLVWMVRILSLTFLMNSLGVVPESLLTREIDFRRRSLGEAAGVVGSGAVSVALACLGYNVWALLFGHLARSGLRNAAMAYLSGWMPRLPTSSAGLREVLAFGMRVTGVRLIVSASAAINTAIIGRLMGGASLGLYSMADGLSSGPHRLSTAVINQLSLPVFSKLQDDRRQLQQYFLKISKYLAVISLPAQVGLALIADDLVAVLLQEKWRAMTALFQLFCVGNVFYVLSVTAVPLLYARGRTDVVLRFNWVSAVSLAVAFAVGSQLGLSGLGIALLLVLIPLRIGLLRLGLGEAGIPLRDYLRMLVSPAAGTVAMIFAVWIGGMAYEGHAGTLAHMILAIAAGAVAYAVTLLAVDQDFSVEIRHFIRDIVAPSEA